MKSIGVVSLGCPKNTVDTENFLGDLTHEGYRLTDDHQNAEILIVNTCGFLASSAQESVDAILEMARYKTEGQCRQLVVTGCLAERYNDGLLEQIPEIDALLGVGQYPNLKSILDTGPAGGNGNPSSRNYVNDPASYFEPSSHRIQTTPFYTTYLKIGEGCSNKCAFCIIPKMRGPFRSFSLESLVKETQKLALQGVREFNLVSQDTTMYGVDLKMKDGLVTLLQEMVKVPDVDWIRLLYCYPTFINEALIDYVASEPKVCRYFDIPLQHTHDEVLKLMKRQEREQGVRQMLATIRSKIPDVALRTTMIVGFPGETVAHFEHMLRFVEEEQFDHLGVFTYSNEEGTTAFDLPNQVPTEVAEERRDRLMQAQQEISKRKNADLVGQTLPVLVEGISEDEGYLLTGRLATQAPDIDGQVIIENSEAIPGQIRPMKITGATEYDVIAQCV